MGGGFGGIFAARALRDAPVRRSRSSTGRRSTCSSRCCTSARRASCPRARSRAPLRRLFRKHRNLECICAEAVNVDAARRRLICLRPLGRGDRGALRSPHRRRPACGSRTSGTTSSRELGAWHEDDLRRADDPATRVRRVRDGRDCGRTPAEQQHWLTFALVGAGPTGVELAGQIRELATKTLRAEYRRVQPEDARVVLFDGGSAPLASFGPRLSRQGRADAARARRRAAYELHRDQRGRQRPARAGQGRRTNPRWTRPPCCGRRAWRPRRSPRALAAATGAEPRPVRPHRRDRTTSPSPGIRRSRSSAT